MSNKDKTEIAVSGTCSLSSSGESAVRLCKRSIFGETITPQIDFQIYEKEINAIDTGPHELYRVQKLLLVAFLRASQMAGLTIKSQSTECAGVFFGNSYGIEEFKSAFFRCYKKSDPILTSPTLFPFTTANALSSWLAIQVGAKGPSITFVSGSISSSEAIIAACDALVANTCKVAIVGGVNIINNDFKDAFCASGFKYESIGVVILEKNSDVKASGRKPLAILKNCQNRMLSQKQIEKVKLEKSIIDIDDKMRSCFKVFIPELINFGNVLGESIFDSGKNGLKKESTIGKIFCLNDAIGNTFDASGVFGVALCTELLNMPPSTGWNPFNSLKDSIIYSNIGSNNSAITILISKA
jgi:hypothetical protein